MPLCHSEYAGGAHGEREVLEVHFPMLLIVLDSKKRSNDIDTPIQ